MAKARVNHFDRAKPFYPIVVQYIAQLIGVKELAVRAVLGPLQLDALVDCLVSARDASDASSATVQLVAEGTRKLVGPLQLRSEYQDNTIRVDIDDLAKDFRDNHSYVMPFFLRAAGVVLIVAHEISKDAAWYDHGPLWEFLRHCRNAAAHGGTFAFHAGEPRRPAVWGKFRITSDFQGTALFKTGKTEGLISPGDPIRLLWDIEQAYPEMVASPQEQP